MDLFLLHAAMNAVVVMTLALSFGLAMLLERWCRSTIFRLMFAGVIRANKINKQS